MANLDARQTVEFRTRLDRRAEQLRAEIRGTMARSNDETHVHIAERARDAGDDSFSDLIVDVNLSEIERDADELRRIGGALARLEHGAFGTCVDCSREIPLARLQAEPTAARCIRCQELYEKTHATPATPTL